MKENAIKWEKIVVDVQNIVFYRRSIGLYGDFVKKINRTCEEDQRLYGGRINRIIGDFVKKINRII